MSIALTQTTLSAALSANATVLNVASATGIVNPTNNFSQKLYIIDQNQTRGELVTVVNVSGTAITVSRLDEYRAAHISGALVVIAPIDASLGPAFHSQDPTGVPPSGAPAYTPFINVVSGNQWLVGIPTQWVPGFGNLTAPPGPTAAVASAAGAVLPTGPLFHITGTSAITGFTLPVGFMGGSFTVIPDAVFTWTAAGNIALAGTAVVSKALTFTWDSNAVKWFPSYIA